MSFLTGAEMKDLYRAPEEKKSLRHALTESALKHSNTCICGVCRYVFPECYAQCDDCGRHDLEENMQACFTMSEGGEVDHYVCEKCTGVES